MKKIGRFLVVVSLMFTMNVKAFEINSNNAILINLNEDMVLYEKNSEDSTKIASLTKIMTAIVALENIDNLDEKVILTYEDFRGLAALNAVTAGFRVGEKVTYRDLLYGLLLPSGADAALALARNISGSNEEFVKLMNEKAKELKLENTYFVNTTGLDKEFQKSTVKDVSILFKYAIKNEEFLKIIKTDSYTTSDKTLTFKSTLTNNKNNLKMDYLLGGKTGTTLDAGLCLASIASYNDVDYMLITTNAPYDKKTPYNFMDAKTIYEYYMNNYGYKTLVKKNDILVKIKTKNSNKDEVIFKSSVEVKKYLNNDFKLENVKLKYSGLEELSYKNKKGEVIGRVEVIYENEVMENIDIVLNEKLKFDLRKYILSNIHIILTIICIIVLLIIIKKKLAK